MAFEGDLSNLSLGDVLQTLAMSRQTGTFIVRNASEERRLLFGPRGCGLLTVRNSTRERVAEYLRGRGKVTPEIYEQVQRLARRRKDVAVEDLLLEKGVVGEKEVVEARRYVSAEDVYDLFLWTQGTFEFVSAEATDQSPYGNVWFDVVSISMEAARRMDEVGRLRTTCPLGEVFVRIDGADPEAVAKVGRDAGQVWEILDGTRTVDGLLGASNLGRFDTWKALDSLREAGLVRSADGHELASVADHLVGDKDWTRAAQILRRLLEVNPDDAAARRRLIDSLVASGDKKAAAREWTAVADAALSGGDAAAAVESYGAATKLGKEDSAAWDGLARARFAAGDLTGGAEAARTAVTLLIEEKSTAAAVDLAELAVASCPDDSALRLSLASAHVAAGDPAAGLVALDEAASLLEAAGDDERRLADVYRRVLHLDPSRKDCARRIEQIESSARFRRRRNVQRAAVALGVVLAGLASIPVFRGPGFEAQMESARLALAEDRASDVERILAELEAGSPSEDEAIEIRVLRDAVAAKGPRARLEEASRRLAESLRRLSEEAATAQSAGWAAVLGKYGAALDVLDGRDAKLVGSSDVNTLNRLRRELMEDMVASFQAMYAETAAFAAKVTAARERFTAEAFRKEDAAVLEDLVARTQDVARIRSAQDWADVARAVDVLRKRVPKVKDGLDRKTADALQAMNDGFPHVEREGARALALLRKRRLLDLHRATHSKTQELMGAGRLDDAAEACRTFVAMCDDIRRAEPRELYDPIVADWLDGMNLEKPVRDRATEIERIRAAEEEADAAVESGDLAQAFRLRSDLVRNHRGVDFRTRFRLPVRIESRPAGASVTVADGSDSGRPLGASPVARFEYGIDERVRITVALEGFEERTVERVGALEDEGGVLVVDLPKKADFAAAGCGNVQAAAVAVSVGADVRIVTAGRDGRVRLVSSADGTEAAPAFSAGSLAGFAAAPAAVGNRVLAATLDGTGFVLDAATLRPVGEIRLDGPVRAALVAVPGGVAVATETGTVSLVGADGRVLWTKRAGRVLHDPVVAGHRVAVVTADGEVVAWDAATGGDEVRVRLPDDPRWGAPFASGDRVWVAGDGGGVACADLGARRVVWSVSLGTSIRARPTLAAGRLLVATAQGAVHSLSPADGRETGREGMGGAVRHAPLAVGDGWVVATDRGAVVRFAADGTIAWRYDAKDDLTSPPALVAGRIVFATRRGTLVALRP